MMVAYGECHLFISGLLECHGLFFLHVFLMVRQDRDGSRFLLSNLQQNYSTYCMHSYLA